MSSKPFVFERTLLPLQSPKDTPVFASPVQPETWSLKCITYHFINTGNQ